MSTSRARCNIKFIFAEKFEATTGIKLVLTTFGSNDEAESTVRANGGKGFDVVFPCITNSANYVDDNGDSFFAELPADVNTDAVIPSFLRDSASLGGVYKGQQILLPFDWGTEGIITWLDSFGMLKAAENKDQAVAFMNFMLQPEIGGMFANNTGYNSAVAGAADFASEEFKSSSTKYTARMFWRTCGGGRQTRHSLHQCATNSLKLSQTHKRCVPMGGPFAGAVYFL